MFVYFHERSVGVTAILADWTRYFELEAIAWYMHTDR
jgi:hypothetical protein